MITEFINPQNIVHYQEIIIKFLLKADVLNYRTTVIEKLLSDKLTFNSTEKGGTVNQRHGQEKNIENVKTSQWLFYVNPKNCSYSRKLSSPTPLAAHEASSTFIFVADPLSKLCNHPQVTNEFIFNP